MFRTMFNFDRDSASLESGLAPGNDRMTKDSFAEDSDINVIVRRFGLGAELPLTTAVPLEGDFTSVVDYHTALNLVRQADESFMELPAAVRARFQNDPGQLVAWLSEESNRDEAVKLGLVNAPVVPAAEVKS